VAIFFWWYWQCTIDAVAAKQRWDAILLAQHRLFCEHAGTSRPTFESEKE
jgi:hypothetical protein